MANLASTNKMTDMHKNAVAMYIQTSSDSGAMKENRPGVSLLGLA